MSFVGWDVDKNQCLVAKERLENAADSTIPWTNLGYIEFNEETEDILNDSQVEDVVDFFLLLKKHSQSKATLISGMNSHFRLN